MSSSPSFAALGVRRRRSAARRVVAGVLAAAGLALAARSSPAQQPPPAQATAIPSADAFVFAGEPNLNYGGAGALAVSDPAQDQGEYQSLMRFDLSSARAAFDAQFGASGWRLESASLRLVTANPGNPIFNANAAGPFAVSWLQNDNWVEGAGTPNSPTTDGVTYNSLPSLLGPADEALGTFNFPGGTSGANTYALALPAGFAADAAAGNPVSLRLLPGADEASYVFNSRSIQTVANRPTLTLTAVVPEPGAAGAAAGAALAAVAASALAARRRPG